MNNPNEIPGLDSEIYFGNIHSSLPDWRDRVAELDHIDDDHPDEEQLDIVANVLGFDPSEDKDDKEENNIQIITPPSASSDRTKRKLIHPRIKSLGYLQKEMIRKKDKLGRNICYDNGKKVSCGGNKPSSEKETKPKPKPESKKPKDKTPKAAKPTAVEVQSMIADATKNGMTKDSTTAIVAKVEQMTNSEIKELLRYMKGKTSGVKKVLVDQVQKALLSHVKEKPAQENDIPPSLALVEVKPIEVQLNQKNPDDPVAKRIAEDAASHAVVKVMAGLAADVQYREAQDAIKNEKVAFDEYRKYLPTDTSPAAETAKREWLDLYKKAKGAKEILDSKNSEMREQFKQAMKPKQPPKIEMAYSKGMKKFDRNNPPTYESDEYIVPPFIPGDEEKESISASIDFVKSITEGAGIDYDVNLGQSPTGRAFFNAVKEQVVVQKGNAFLRLLGMESGQRIEKTVIEPRIRVGTYHPELKDSYQATMIHEMGHMIDELKPGAKKKIEEFLAYRLGDEQLVDMGTLPGGEAMAGEMVRKDDFDRYFDTVSAYYVGKEYKNKDGTINGTEILSMGIEALYRDPAGFCQKDPEYAQFVIGILRM